MCDENMGIYCAILFTFVYIQIFQKKNLGFVFDFFVCLFVLFLVFCLLFETGSYKVAQVGLKFLILLFHSSEKVVFFCEL